MHGPTSAGATGPVGHLVDQHPSVSPERLIASAYREVPGEADGRRKGFATFIEPTQLAGVFGLAECIELPAGHPLVCIDEFELDDPAIPR